MRSAWKEELAEPRGLRIILALDSRPATRAEVIEGWRNDAGFRVFFNALLADAPYAAFRWETPALSIESLSRPFECVLLESPGLIRPPEPGAFAEHHARSEAGIVAFPNLGGDALLIAPCPRADPSVYGHLASFVRLAPEPQRQALWQAVGESLTRRLGRKPVWLSTAGDGVSWLHVRLDDRPKYYGFAPYRASHDWAASSSD